MLVNSYQAEYAGNGGPIVQVVTRRGKENPRRRIRVHPATIAINANDFFQQSQWREEAAVRPTTPSAVHLGGPVTVHPGHWNHKTKMFVF